MRKQERDIQQKKVDRQHLKATLRRMKEPQESNDEGSHDQKRRKITKTREMSTMNEKAENKKFAGELDTTEKGLLRFKSDCWQKMDKKKRSLLESTMHRLNMAIHWTNSQCLTGFALKTGQGAHLSSRKLILTNLTSRQESK
jgi:hypothetical protein